MKIVLLPGERRERLAKTQEAAFSLANFADSFLIHYYDHWHDGSELNLDKESSKLKKLKEDHLVVAEGEGIHLALKGIADNKLSPRVCVFIRPQKESKNSASKFLNAEKVLWINEFSENSVHKVLPFIEKSLSEGI